MKRAIESFLRPVAKAVRRTVKSNATIRNLMHDVSNSAQFTDLRRHEIMLADSVRIDAYRDGLAGCVRPGDVVLDLGAGSGILSLLAARRNPKVIYAVDHSPFIDVARRIAAQNKVECIEFIHANSRTYIPPEKVDVIIHEQMGPALFGENLVENLLDLKRRVLKPGGLIAPGRFDVFVEPVALKADQIVPDIADIEIDGLNLEFLRNDPQALSFRPLEYGFHPNDPRSAFDHFLAEPEPLISFDLNAIERANEIPNVYEMTRTIVRPGALNGLCVYFRATFANGVNFDTSPASRFTHWTNRIFRMDGRSLRSGDTLKVKLALKPLSDPRLWTAVVE